MFDRLGYTPCVGTFVGHEGPVHSVAFCRDPTMLVSASADQTARIWSVDGRCLAVLQHKDEVRAACFGARRTAAELQFCPNFLQIVCWECDT